MQDTNLFHLTNNLVYNICLPHGEIFFTGTGDAPCKLRKENSRSVTV